ncbi:hypothetical protein Tco_1117329 [Tanacetum coccineum]
MERGIYTTCMAGHIRMTCVDPVSLETATYGKIWYDKDVYYLRFFEEEFPAIVYNDALTSKSDFSSEPTVSPQHVNELNLKNETSLSEYDDEKYNVISYNDLFPFNIIYVNDSKVDKDNDDDNIDIKQSLGDISIEPLPNVVDTAYPTQWIRRIQLNGYGVLTPT